MNNLDGLTNNLNGLRNWLLDNWLGNILNLGGLNILDLWCGLYIFYRLMNHLSFNCLIFNSFCYSLNWNIFSECFVINLRNVLSLVFHSVVICHFLLSWHVFDSLNCFIFCDASFVGNVFDSGFTFNDLLLLNDLNRLLNNLHGLLDNLNGLLNHLNRLLNHLNWLMNILNGLICFNRNLSHRDLGT